MWLVQRSEIKQGRIRNSIAPAVNAVSLQNPCMVQVIKEKQQQLTVVGQTLQAKSRAAQA